jgi:hypothetical protein
MSNSVIKMETVTSVSGGRTSAYIADNYHSDHLLFALVRTDDIRCQFPDKALRALVEDRIQKPFIGTLEDDMIIYTMLDLEQHLGRPINWVSGITFDEVIKRGWLPNKLHRFCTTEMKITPMFYWWAENIGQPVLMNIGYRANEISRANDMNAKLNANGLLEFEATFEKHASGRHKGLNKWQMVEWQKPQFKLIEDGIYAQDIDRHWKGKPVRFADYNNCAGCFHRNVYFLRYQFDAQPPKLNWFADQEGGANGYWKSESGGVIPYRSIEKMMPQQGLFKEDFKGCDDGYCGF